ncbi:MAG: hypothetical protein WBB28_20805 [Crinalium sp.]
MKERNYSQLAISAQLYSVLARAGYLAAKVEWVDDATTSLELLEVIQKSPIPVLLAITTPSFLSKDVLTEVGGIVELSVLQTNLPFGEEKVNFFGSTN